MLKIEFNNPQNVKVSETRKKSKQHDGYDVTPVFEDKETVFAKSISHTKKVVNIEMTSGYLFSYNTSDGNRIKSILPFNENQTKQFKIV